MFRRVAERFAQARDRGIQVVLEIDEDLRRPEPVLELLTRDDLAGALEEQRQDLEGLFAQADAHASFVKPTGREVDLELAESNGFRHLAAAE
jgi:hypothetical protein